MSTPFLQMLISKAISQPLWITINGLVTYVLYCRLLPVLEKSGYIRRKKPREEVAAEAK